MAVHLGMLDHHSPWERVLDKCDIYLGFLQTLTLSSQARKGLVVE
jgi:hypothetical protein